MKVTITSRHFDLTDAIRAHVDEKFEQLAKHFEQQIRSVEVVLDIEKGGNQLAEANVHMTHGPVFHAHANDNDMYTSINMMVDKIRTQIQRHKEQGITARDHKSHDAIMDGEVRE